MEKKLTQKNISLLLSGKHPLIKKFAGKNVMVVGNEIVPLQ
jgi:cation diffusion facilitator CzcD-associated flavoprotein CzcO